jgi:glycine/D-amino acid oxidase-like deaminating enzyme
VNEASVWTAPFAVLERSAPAEVPARTDVAVIGAGITGLAAALASRKRGASVTVLEAAHAGFGASSRNGGMALTGLKLGPGVLLRRYGERTARAMFDASLRAIDLIESLIETEGIDCAFERCGHLEVASKPSHFRAFAETAQLLATRFDHRVRLVAREELVEEIGSSAFYGGLVDERSAGLDPAKYVAGLAAAARRAGAVVCDRAPVEGVERTRGGWRLKTPRGEVVAGAVMAATGAYTGVAFGALRRLFVPVGSYAIATESLPPDLAASLIPRRRMVFDSKRLLHYFRLTPDRRMLFGGRAAFLPESTHTTSQSAEMLRRDMTAFFPQLSDARLEFAWGGTLDVAFDIMPHAGVLDGIHYAFGYAGHGVALATLLGTLAAGAIVDGSVEHPFARSAPAAPLRLYDGRPWFLPLAGAWQRLLDAVN